MPLYLFWVWRRWPIRSIYIARPSFLRNRLRRELFHALAFYILNGLCYALHAVLIYHLKKNYMPWHVHRQHLVHTWVWKH
ncbi:protein E16C [Elephant endotheliotropic herpesvirus 2]|nr:protein E16C [Elephant endotheliotropic herpesvirus 2]